MLDFDHEGQGPGNLRRGARGIPCGSSWFSDKTLYLGRRTWDPRGAASLEEPEIEGLGCAGHSGRWRWPLAMGDGPGDLSWDPRWIELPVIVCVYFSSLIRDLVVESRLSIPACCQVLPTGK